MNLSHLMLAAAVMCTAPSASADDFDLTSQRSEIQEFNSVPGHRIDRRGTPTVNPTPQSMQLHGGTLRVANGFKVNDKRKRFASDLDFITKHRKGSKLTLDFGRDKSLHAEGYRLEVTPSGITITGADERGAFYGLQTLRQLLQQYPAEMPLLTITDYPEFPHRGVVEGFYGTPWSHEVRLSLIDFYGKNKLNDYIYGPKDDPYHSSPNWRLPYPPDQEQKIRELVDAARRARVNFVWAIHPGKDIRWDKADYDSLVNKLDMMYALGVRDFALFFDDIDGIGTDPARQAALVNDLTRDFVTAKGDVSDLMICPTDYSQLWAKPGPEGPLAVYGRDLTDRAEVFWTGAVVCSDLTEETLDFVNSRIRRPALFWWNFPVTDYCRNIILQGPVYGLDTALTSKQVSGIESNPMEHGEASKLALYGVADWAWNPTAYNAIDNWERGLAYLAPNAADAYRTFAIHNADTETGYRRDESWETTTFSLTDNYTPAQMADLRAEFEKVAAAPATMRANAGNELLLSELSPWLTEFEKLGQRGLRTLDLIESLGTESDSTFWCNYVANLMTEADRAAYQAHKTGTMKLQPFYENAMDAMLINFYEKVAGSQADTRKGIGSYPNLRTILSKLMLDGDASTYYTSANSQKAGDWIGVDLGRVCPVREVTVLQGRNSVDDVDYFDHAILEASANGSEWTPLTDSLTRTYEVRYNDVPVHARYVRLRRLPSERANWASVREFTVNPPSADRIGLDIVSSQPDDALRAFDSNPATQFTTSGVLSFNRQPGADTLIILASEVTSPAYLTQFDSEGRTIATTRVADPWTSVALSPATTRLSLNGTATLHQIIQR